LALSIGAIKFVGSLPTDPSTLTIDLAEFGFSFLILINVWNRYTSTTSVIPVETSWMVRLNMVLLFLVAIEPFLFDVLVGSSLGSGVGVAASEYYGFDIAGMNLILAYFTHLLASEEKNLIPREMIGRYKTIRNLLIVGAAMFLVSELPIFWSIIVEGLPLRIVLWMLTLPVVRIQRLLGGT
jgi:uncharacterized membrane protein